MPFHRFYSKSNQGRVIEICRDLEAPLEKEMLKIKEKFLNAIGISLVPETRHLGGVPCFNTHISRFPKTFKKGEYLSMHLGGDKLEFMRLTVEGKGNMTPRKAVFEIPESVKRSSGFPLFDFIAENLRDFVFSQSTLRTEHVPIVFSFSFPLDQTSIDRGRIQKWAKGFRCERIIGHDVNKLLRNAANKYGVSLDIKAIVNNVCGTFLAGRVSSSLCAGGIVLGLGTNASYLEHRELVPDYDGDGSTPYVLINTEWGAFGEAGELANITTEFDEALDIASENIGSHKMEKMVGSLYTGELVRLITKRLVEEGVILEGRLPNSLEMPNSFKASYIPLILRGEDPFGSLGGDIESVAQITRSVCMRSSRLLAVCVAALVNRMDLPVTAFAISGHFVSENPFMADVPRKARDIAGPGFKRITFIPVASAALTGAAVLSSSMDSLT